MRLQIILLLLIITAVGWGSPLKQNPNLRKPASAEEAKFLQEITATDLNIPIQISVMLSKDVNLDMMLIPAGTFLMGSTNNEKKRRKNEGPKHEVTITKNFYLGKFEVNQQQYGTIIGMRKTKFTGNEMPMDNVNWYHVNGFTGTLTNKFNLQFRLPTEAEWEYACRAGTTTPFYTGQMITPKQANYDCRKNYTYSPAGMYWKMTRPGGKYSPNAFGLYDMCGNLWEWCSDFYKPGYYKKSPDKNPQGPIKGTKRVVRGGAWNEDPDKLRSAVRGKRGHGADRKNLGFRILLEITEHYDGVIKQKIYPINQADIDQNNQTQPLLKIEYEMIFDEETQQGYIAVKGKGLEARNWMLHKIEQICSSKNIVIEAGKKPEAGYYRLLDEMMIDGVYTIKFEAIR